MLSRPQQILLKRAQREAGIADAEYRQALAMVSGLPDCASSTDARLSDEHLDSLLSYFEAIFWRKVDTEDWHLHAPGNGVADVFRVRGFWAARNRKGETSRDRFVAAGLAEQANALEAELAGLGFGLAYLQGIQNRIQPFSLVAYVAALSRTVAAKRRARSSADQPF